MPVSETSITVPTTRLASESKQSAFIGVYRRPILMRRANAKLSEPIVSRGSTPINADVEPRDQFVLLLGHYAGHAVRHLFRARPRHTPLLRGRARASTPTTRLASESKQSAFIGVYRRPILMRRANAKLSEQLLAADQRRSTRMLSRGINLYYFLDTIPGAPRGLSARPRHTPLLQGSARG